jgi:periplasmic divalent cation tolerance protein
MKSVRSYALVMVTAPSLEVGRALARAALEARLAACVNLVPNLESHYWWDGQLEHSAEVLLVLKTTRARLAALEKLILSNHSYDTAEFLVLPVQAGSQRYLEWLARSVEPQKGGKARLAGGALSHSLGGSP